jgi:hypothetical protein
VENLNRRILGLTTFGGGGNLGRGGATYGALRFLLAQLQGISMYPIFIKKKWFRE